MKWLVYQVKGRAKLFLPCRFCFTTFSSFKKVRASHNLDFKKKHGFQKIEFSKRNLDFKDRIWISKKNMELMFTFPISRMQREDCPRRPVDLCSLFMSLPGLDSSSSQKKFTNKTYDHHIIMMSKK